MDFVALWFTREYGLGSSFLYRRVRLIFQWFTRICVDSPVVYQRVWACQPNSFLQSMCLIVRWFTRKYGLIARYLTIEYGLSSLVVSQLVWAGSPLVNQWILATKPSGLPECLSLVAQRIIGDYEHFSPESMGFLAQWFIKEYGLDCPVVHQRIWIW